MFGPYEIEYEGRKYFGNVPLREFHKFDRNGGTYLFIVEDMSAHRISDSLSRFIDRVSASAGLIPETVFEELKKLGLLEEETEDAAAETRTDAAEGDDKDRKAAFGVRSIALFVAQECNMRCVYCYGDGGEYAEKGLMSDAMAFKAVDWLMDNSRSNDEVNISFFGGEPLLNFPLIRKVVEYAKAKASERGKKVTFGITTNASLLTDEVIDLIEKEKITPLVSFDGSAAIQNRQRPFKDGSPSYDTVRGNIRKLLAVSPNFLTRGTVCGDTDPCEMKAGMKEEGLRASYIIKASRVIAPGENGGAADSVDDEAMSNRMMAFQEKESDAFLKSVRDRNMELNQAGHMVRPILTGEKRYFGCGLGRGMAAITISGDIYPCHRFAGLAEMKMGNIADYRVEGPNDYHRNIVMKLPKCSVCWAKYFCGGGCSYEHKSRTGDIRAPHDSYCREVKAAAEAAVCVSTLLDEEDRDYVVKSYKDYVEEKIP